MPRATLPTDTHAPPEKTLINVLAVGVTWSNEVAILGSRDEDEKSVYRNVAMLRHFYQTLICLLY